jgi:hypothetical protein
MPINYGGLMSRRAPQQPGQIQPFVPVSGAPVVAGYSGAPQGLNQAPTSLAMTPSAVTQNINSQAMGGGGSLLRDSSVDMGLEAYQAMDRRYGKGQQDWTPWALGETLQGYEGYNPNMTNLFYGDPSAISAGNEYYADNDQFMQKSIMRNPFTGEQMGYGDPMNMKNSQMPGANFWNQFGGSFQGANPMQGGASAKDVGDRYAQALKAREDSVKAMQEAIGQQYSSFQGTYGADPLNKFSMTQDQFTNAFLNANRPQYSGVPGQNVSYSGRTQPVNQGANNAWEAVARSVGYLPEADTRVIYKKPPANYMGR